MQLAMTITTRESKALMPGPAIRRILLLGAIATLSGCSPVASPGPTRPDLSGRNARILATTTLAADLVTQVGGPWVDVSALMPPGVDPHQYKPSAGDVRKLQQADLIVFHGLHLEGRMADLLADLRHRLRVVELAASIPEHEWLRGSESSDSAVDPHLWMDVSLWAKAIVGVRDALIELDPAHRAEYEARAAAYQRELEALDREIRDTVATLPTERRILVTAHDAFRYFGRAYGFEVRGLQGISTVSEPGISDVQDLARFIADRRIPTIFAEQSVPDRNLLAVQQAVRRISDHEVRFSPAKLYSDSLGEPGGEAGTYIDMMRHNVRTIVSGLTDFSR